MQGVNFVFKECIEKVTKCESYTKDIRENQQQVWSLYIQQGHRYGMWLECLIKNR